MLLSLNSLQSEHVYIFIYFSFFQTYPLEDQKDATAVALDVDNLFLRVYLKSQGKFSPQFSTNSTGCLTVFWFKVLYTTK